MVSAAPTCAAVALAAFDETLRMRGLADRTRAEYLRWLSKLAGHTGCDPARLDEAEVREFLLHLHVVKNYAPSTQRIVLGAVNLFYRVHLGRDWRLLKVARAPRSHGQPRVLTRRQIARLWEEVTEPRFRTLLRLVYACGLRIGEALGLEVSDIDREGPYVRVRRGKGNRARRVPLPPAMLGELRDWWRMHRHPRWLFPAPGFGCNATGPDPERLRQAERPMRPGTVQTRLRRARRAADLPAETTPHALRHSYATHLLEEGVCIRVISACLGHSALQTTLIYARVTPASEARARAAAARLIEGEGAAREPWARDPLAPGMVD